ncbi:P-type conjugative transfer protein TrbJ [Pseudoxanthomonas sp. UTMC 1351]|uniref:P-type conjugative transfer protein TrbJ n=1 Tax=Pseudoxanthomonas sp. UTMC 1351 TaxID=2695853 RepID=UPI0034CD8640
MKRVALSAGGALAIGLAVTGSVRAQMAVFDPANFQQNLLTATRTLEQVHQQVQQLQNEAQMLANQARNLQPLDLDSLTRLRAALARTEQLLDEARDLSFDVTQAQREFARLYPERYSGEVTSGQLQADAQERWTGSLEALRTAIRLQAQVVENVADDETVLTDLVGASQSAAGALQAAQATNQLLALQAKQLIQAQQLHAAHGRATALEQARTVAAEERARELRRRFMTSRTPYTSESVRLFGEGGD